MSLDHLDARRQAGTNAKAACPHPALRHTLGICQGRVPQLRLLSAVLSRAFPQKPLPQGAACGPVAKTLNFHAGALRLHPWEGNRPYTHPRTLPSTAEAWRRQNT